MEKQIKYKKCKFRRMSYYKKVAERAELWFQENNDNTHMYTTSERVKVQEYLRQRYKMYYTSSSMRTIRGDKIGKQGSWSVRVDYYDYSDKKLYNMFIMTYSPIIVDSSWFFPRRKRQG
jgi:hypothetical protein